MTKEELIQYSDLKTEIEKLERRIEKVKKRIKQESTMR